MKLGAVHRIAPRAISPLRDRARLDLTIPPPSVDWHSACPADGDTLGNDRYGCCVPAADFRLIQMHRANAWGTNWKPTEAMVLDRYAKLTGFNPVTGTPDDGTDTTEDLKDWCGNGIRTDPQTEDVPLWATVDPHNDNEISLAIALCGGVLVTLNLPLAAQDADQWNSNHADNSPQWTAGSWGQHRVLCGKYDGSVRTVRTWGRDVPVSPSFWVRYCLGVDVLLSREWVRTTGLAPSGLDWDALRNDMTRL